MARSALMLAAAAVTAWGAMAASAHAQLSSSGGPISYSAANLEYFDGERRLVLTGDVDVVQGDARLRSDSLTLYFAAGSGGQSGVGSGDIQRMVAEGQVYYVRPQQQARGDRAIYDVASDSVTFSGNVVVASDANVLRGETLVLEVNSGRTRMTPGANRGRIQGVFRPRNSGASGQ
ncbi:MAG: LptA/OstA family protein [Hyphomonadaceae bacterium]